jgi:peptidoglycan/LPS O-acetylase OafA/YrhL
MFVFWQNYAHGLMVLQAIAPERWMSEQQYNPVNYNVGWWNTLIHATFLFGLLPKYAASNISADWSIGLEMQFYAAFPLLFFALRKPSWIAMVIGIFVLSVFCNHGFAHLPGQISGVHGLFSEPSFLLMKLPVFLIGMLAGEVFCETDRTTRQRTFMTICALALASYYSGYVTTVAAIMFWLAWCHQPGLDWEGKAISNLINYFLSNRLAVFMADTSYCVYLCHGFFISFLGGYLFQQDKFLALHPLERIAIFTALVCVGAYLLAWILHHLVEKPCIELGRKLTNRWVPTLKVATIVPIVQTP